MDKIKSKLWFEHSKMPVFNTISENIPFEFQYNIYIDQEQMIEATLYKTINIWFSIAYLCNPGHKIPDFLIGIEFFFNPRKK